MKFRNHKVAETASQNGLVKAGDRVTIEILNTKPPQFEKITILKTDDRIPVGTEIDGYTFVSDASPLAKFALGKKLGFEADHKLPSGLTRLKITEIIEKYRLE